MRVSAKMLRFVLDFDGHVVFLEGLEVDGWGTAWNRIGEVSAALNRVAKNRPSTP